MSMSILKLIFGFILLFGVSFFLRNNLDNWVLLLSYVDLLITKFTISFNELRVDHRFLLLDEYLSFQLEFSSVEPTEAFTTSSDPASSFLCQQKSNNTAFRPQIQFFFFFWRDSKPKPQKACSRLIVSTSNYKNSLRKRLLAYAIK